MKWISAYLITLVCWVTAFGFLVQIWKTILGVVPFDAWGMLFDGGLAAAFAFVGALAVVYAEMERKHGD